MASLSPPSIWPLLFALAIGQLSVYPVQAYPSKALDVPNGERVPCPEDGTGCLNGFCRGLGHGTCAGGHVSPALNPFGLDFKAAGFQWTTELCEADSDGDGYTNGEELGDPCCVWARGGGVSSYTSSYVPSHPGNSDHSPPDDYVRPSCDAEEIIPPENTSDGPTETAAFNEGERQGSFEFRIKDYPIPRQETTYVDFVFNLPDDLPEIVHIVYGDAIVSQPNHLHHFVVTGCSSRIDESLEGLPLETVPQECNVPVGGFSGWAPGAIMWDLPTNAGVAIGQKFGIKAFQINVHYTDGDAPYLNGEQAIGTDGIKVYYTPDLRPKTLVASPIINVGFGPHEMVVQPNKTRAFITRTCTVQSRCNDHDDETMNLIGSQALGDPELTCESGAKKFFCASDLFQAACPASCGLCEEGSPRNPDEWSAVAVFYHAHLLGREMYTTLMPRDNPTERRDLFSRDVWSYDDQTPFFFDSATPIRQGDKIQTTCVFDSTSRTDPTRFDLSTYDEMCINTVAVLFDTPAIVEGAETTAANEVFLRSFKCEKTEAGDIWMGELGIDEDAQKIVDDHPLEDATCSFPTGIWIFDSAPTQEMRCNGEIVDKEEGICAGLPGSAFNPRAAAGSSCSGGTFSERDANDGTTKEQCTTGGGQWTPYSCYEAEQWLEASPDVTSELKQYLREYWWQPKCCIGAEESDDKGDDPPSEETAGTTSAAANLMPVGSAFLCATIAVFFAGLF